MAHTKLSALQKDVTNSLAEVLQIDVRSYIVDKVDNRLKVDVYGAYAPQVYTRKHRLYDRRNHRGELEYSGGDRMKFRYYHRAYTSEQKDLSKLIILGQDGARAYGGDIAYYNDDYIKAYKASGATDSKPFYKPRDFLGNARREMSKQDIVNIFKRELKWCLRRENTSDT